MTKRQLLAALRADLEDHHALLHCAPGGRTRRDSFYSCVCGVALTLKAGEIDAHISWHENEAPHLLWWRLRLLHPYLPIPACAWRNGDYRPHLWRVAGIIFKGVWGDAEERAMNAAVRFVGTESRLIRNAGFDVPRHPDSRSFALLREDAFRFIVDLFLAGETPRSVQAVFRNMAHERTGATETA